MMPSLPFPRADEDCPWAVECNPASLDTGLGLAMRGCESQERWTGTVEAVVVANVAVSCLW
jgi:hypothetical protein